MKLAPLQLRDVLDELYCASIERPGTMATNSEKRRWIKQGWVRINGLPAKLESELVMLESLVIHPKSSRNLVTLV